VEQFVEVHEDDDAKYKRTLEVLGKWHQTGQILIFCEKQQQVDELFRRLMDAGYPALTLHGGMDQTDRDFTINDFKSGLRSLMVATSVCARGLDVKELVSVYYYVYGTYSLNRFVSRVVCALE
jgi:ATP-dependent RNA helicase DDX46/PRP5